MKKILVIGEILVEIMADDPGFGFLDVQALTGPYPSGAPAIFADQAARMGQPVAIISAVGNDDFGRINLQRLEADGVDIRAIHIDDDRPTGSAFVRYQADGGRNFIFNIRHSACGTLHEGKASAALMLEVQHLHIMGSSLSSPEFMALNLRSAKAIKARGGSISFDPNLRKEMLSAPGMKEAMADILKITDVFLPSGDELVLLSEAEDEAGAIKELLGRGVRVIVHKKGARGAYYYDARQQHFAPAFSIPEVDPTGAGDCFGATFVSLWLRDQAPDMALKFATAAGALAVNQRGPMEGASTLSQIEALIRAKETT